MDHQIDMQAENERLRTELDAWRREAVSLRAALAWTERAMDLHGPAVAQLTIRRARATSDRHRRDRAGLGQ
jgi:hypothetical protein